MQQIKIRLRLVIIQDERLLLVRNKRGDYYFFPGGKLEYGETMEMRCKREVKEEIGADKDFRVGKVLYVKDFMETGESEILTHSLELFILGDITGESIKNGKFDPEYGKEHSFWWKDINNLPKNLLPRNVATRLPTDFKTNFDSSGIYIGEDFKQ